MRFKRFMLLMTLVSSVSALGAENREVAAKTADDQATTTQKDTDITRLIRRKITESSDLSVNAQNIKIITENGRVVLKGSVESKAESMKVEKLAKSVAGSLPVINNTTVEKR